MAFPNKEKTAPAFRKETESATLRQRIADLEQALDSERAQKETLIATMQAEQTRLRQRIADLEQTLSAERTRSATTLRESQSLLHGIVEHTPAAIFVKDLQGRYLVINQATANLVGMSSQDLIGKRDRDIFPEEIVARFRAKVQEVLDTRRSLKVEETIVTSNGEITCLTIKFPIYDMHGNICAIGGIATDITERKKTEDALRLNDERYERAVKAANVGIWDLDLNTREIYLAPNLKALLGYQDHEIQNHLDDWSTHIHPDDRALVEEAFRAHLQGETPFYEVTHRMLHKDGSVRWIIARGSVTRNEGGKPIWMSGTDQDITEQIETQEAYKNLIGYSLQGVLVLQDERIVFANSMVKTITGYEVEELLAFSPQALQAMIHPEDRATVWQYHLNRLHGKPTPPHYTHRLFRKDGDVRWVEVYAIPTQYQGRRATQGFYIDITERKHMEEALRESEQRYRSIISAMQEGVTLHDQDGAIREWNTMARQMLGRSTEKLLGKTTMEAIWNAIHEDGSPFLGINHPSLVALRTGRPCSNVVMGVYRPDETLTWMLVNAQPIFHNDNPIPDGVVTTFTDITEIKRIEQALRESEERYRLISEMVSDFAYALQVRSDGTYVAEWVTDAYQRTTGSSIEDIKTKNDLAELIHPSDLPVIQQHNARLYDGQSSEIEYRIITRDGQTRWLHQHDQVVWDEEQERVVRIYGAGQDITERKQAEEALTTAYKDLEALNTSLQWGRDLLHTVFNALYDGLVLLDQTGVILAANQSFANLIGYDPEALLHRSWFTICQQTAAPFPITPVGQTLHDGQAHSQRERYAVPDRHTTRVLDIQTLPIGQQPVEQVLIHIVDVTEQLTLEAIAIQHERLAASGSLAATIAHEINTPLQSINHCLFLASDPSDQQRDTYLTMARDEISRISKIVRQLLDFHRPSPTHPTHFDINALIGRVLALTNGTLQKHHITVARELHDHLPTIPGYPDQIIQVLMNLILNAKKAMPRGGTLRVSSWLQRDSLPSTNGSEPPPAHQQSHNATDATIEAEPTSVMVAVEDNGTGMPPDIQARIFDSFFTTGSNGSGLGLTISRKIMSQHGGSITVQSEPGQGSTFRLIFPLKHDQIVQEMLS